MTGEGSRTRDVVESVANEAECSPEDLDPPLSEVIDPDALERLFDPVGGSSPVHGHVEFMYLEYLVTVGADGDISVQEAVGWH